MLSLNEVHISGRLVRDPDEIKQTQGGKDVIGFRIVNSMRRFDKTKNEQVEDTVFISVSAFNSLATFVSKYLRKGSPVYVNGVLRYREYTDKEGNKRNDYSILARNIQFLDSKRRADGNGSEDATANLKDKAERSSKVSAAMTDSDSDLDGPDTQLPF